MKNSIWVGMNNSTTNVFGDVFSAKSKMIIDRNGYVITVADNDELNSAEHLVEFLGLSLKAGEIVEVIYDTETGNVEIKRERGIGWYLTVNETSSDITHAAARYWNGSVWKLRPQKALNSDDKYIKVISEKLPYNEYLKGLE